MEAQLVRWMREEAVIRRHGTTEQAPRTRFEPAEAATLHPLAGRPPFHQMHELVRTVMLECTIELDANSYSVPWRLISAGLRWVAGGGRVAIRHDGNEVAAHARGGGPAAASDRSGTSSKGDILLLGAEDILMLAQKETRPRSVRAGPAALRFILGGSATAGGELTRRAAVLDVRLAP